MAIIFVKPRDGFRVIDPETRVALPAEGCRVNDSPYWRRRERDKDITVTEEKSAPDNVVAAEKEG